MDDSSESKSFMKRFQERLAASRFFTFSLLLHIALVFILGGVVLFKAYVEPPDFVAEGGGLVGDEQAAQAPPPDTPPDVTQQTFTPETPQVNAPTIDTI